MHKTVTLSRSLTGTQLALGPLVHCGRWPPETTFPHGKRVGRGGEVERPAAHIGHQQAFVATLGRAVCG